MMSMFGSFTNLESQQQLLHKSYVQQPLHTSISDSRKRMRDQINDEILSIPFGNNTCHPSQITGGAANVVFNNDNSSFDQQSTMTSTSGGGGSSIYDSRDNLMSCLRSQNLEIDGIVRLQTERLRSVLEETTKRQCRALLSVVEKRVQKKLAEKDSEIEKANRRSLMLEEKLKQLTAENQIWFGVARNNEAVVTTLRTNLQQILLRQNNNNQIPVTVVPEEGFGDSGDAEEQQSGFYPQEEKEDDEEEEVGKSEKQSSVPTTGGGGCKSCEFGEASILLLPCRHLCLCKSCQSKVDTCPICHSSSYGCIEVVVS